MIVTGHSELLCMQASVMSQEVKVHPSPCHLRAYLKISLVTLGILSLRTPFSQETIIPPPPSVLFLLPIKAIMVPHSAALTPQHSQPSQK